MNKFFLSFKLARVQYTPLIIIPILLGTALALREGYSLNWLNFFLALVGSWFAHLGANAANDVFDDISGVDKIAYEKIPENRGSAVCGSEVLTRGMLSRKEGFIVTAIFFFLALCFGLPLIFQFGLPIAIIAISGFLLGIFYCAKPLAFGYIGRGLGELAVFISFGVLPVLGAYWVQTGSFSYIVLAPSATLGIFTVAVLYNHHFTHGEADKLAGKMSPVVVLGEKRARRISLWILLTAYLSIIVNTVLGFFPPLALTALITAPFVLRSYATLSRPAKCSESLNFLSDVVKANIITGLLIVTTVVLNTAL